MSSHYRIFNCIDINRIKASQSRQIFVGHPRGAGTNLKVGAGWVQITGKKIFVSCPFTFSALQVQLQLAGLPWGLIFNPHSTPYHRK